VASPAKPAELGDFGDFGVFWGFLGILGIENRELKIENFFSLSKPATTTQKKNYFYFF
jgi:hypothetical protein